MKIANGSVYHWWIKIDFTYWELKIVLLPFIGKSGKEIFKWNQ